MIYFDNSATTKIYPEAAQAMMAAMEKYFANPSSLHRLGVEAGQLLTSARRQIAQIIGCKPNEVIFTSSGTESNNLAIKGTVLAKKDFGKHIITSSIEHPSVRNIMQELKKAGFEITVLPVDATGKINVADLRMAIRNDTILVSIMAINNEIGSIQPIKEVGDVLNDFPTIHFHVDGVQSFAKLDTTLIHPRVDMVSFSAHKFNGPRGVGILYKQEKRQIKPLLNGGGQEFNLRSSTENLAGIVAAAKAMRLSAAEADSQKKRHQAMQTMLRTFMAQHHNTIRVFSPTDGAPHILCFGLKGVRGEVLVHALEAHEIYISTTSACSSRQNDAKFSTLQAMRIDGTWARQAVRLSMGKDNTVAEAEEFVEVLAALMQKFKKIQ